MPKRPLHRFVIIRIRTEFLIQNGIVRKKNISPAAGTAIAAVPFLRLQVSLCAGAEHILAVRRFQNRMHDIIVNIQRVDIARLAGVNTLCPAFAQTVNHSACHDKRRAFGYNIHHVGRGVGIVIEFRFRCQAVDAIHYRHMAVGGLQEVFAHRAVTRLIPIVFMRFRFPFQFQQESGIQQIPASAVTAGNIIICITGRGAEITRSCTKIQFQMQHTQTAGTIGNHFSHLLPLYDPISHFQIGTNLTITQDTAVRILDSHRVGTCPECTAFHYDSAGHGINRRTVAAALLKRFQVVNCRVVATGTAAAKLTSVFNRLKRTLNRFNPICQSIFFKLLHRIPTACFVFIRADGQYE